MMNHYTPKVIMPIGGKTRISPWEVEASGLRGCVFLSKNRLKKRVNTWRPGKFGWLSINVVEYEDSKPTWKTNRVFDFPEKRENFIVELANLSDLHGIIQISGNAIWVRKAENLNELNIDATILNRISLKLGGVRL